MELRYLQIFHVVLLINYFCSISREAANGQEEGTTPENSIEDKAGAENSEGNSEEQRNLEENGGGENTTSETDVQPEDKQEVSQTEKQEEIPNDLTHGESSEEESSSEGNPEVGGTEQTPNGEIPEENTTKKNSENTDELVPEETTTKEHSNEALPEESTSKEGSDETVPEESTTKEGSDEAVPEGTPTEGKEDVGEEDEGAEGGKEDETETTANENDEETPDSEEPETEDEVKPGTCDDDKTEGLPVCMQCDKDDDCPSALKCCGYSWKRCCQIVNVQEIDTQKKFGVCDNRHTSGHENTGCQKCRFDAECPELDKCCGLARKRCCRRSHHLEHEQEILDELKTIYISL